MSLTLALLLPLAVTGMAGGGFLLNEWTHGAMAEAMGLGHHHVLDADAAHCGGHGAMASGVMAAHAHGASDQPGCSGGGPGA